jgi:hypothetical protein
MRGIVSIGLFVLMLGAGAKVCFSGDPELSITLSNQSVVLTWPKTATNWILNVTSNLRHVSYESNGIIYIEAERLPSPTAQGEDGTNFYAVYRVEPDVSRFFRLQSTSNSLVRPPFAPPTPTVSTNSDVVQ